MSTKTIDAGTPMFALVVLTYDGNSMSVWNTEEAAFRAAGEWLRVNHPDEECPGSIDQDVLDDFVSNHLGMGEWLKVLPVDDCGVGFIPTKKSHAELLRACRLFKLAMESQGHHDVASYKAIYAAIENAEGVNHA